MTESLANSHEEPDYLKDANEGLYRLHSGEEMKILVSSDWLTEGNRNNIHRMVNYDFPSFGSDLTLGGFIDTDSEYIVDICDRVLKDGSILTQEEFLASFLEQFRTEDPEKRFELSRDINELEGEKRKQFVEMLKEFLIRRQITIYDVYLALGIYIVQKAHERGIISVEGYKPQKISLKLEPEAA